MSEFDITEQQCGNAADNNSPAENGAAQPELSAQNTAQEQPGIQPGVQPEALTETLNDEVETVHLAEEPVQGASNAYEAGYETLHAQQEEPQASAPMSSPRPEENSAYRQPAQEDIYAAYRQPQMQSYNVNPQTYGAQVPPSYGYGAQEQPPQQVYNPFQMPPQMPNQPHMPTQAQPYSRDNSQGSYQPDGNGFVYSPPQKQKKKGAGRAIILTIAAILSVFVISVGSISAYNFWRMYSGNALRNPFADQDGSSPSDKDKNPPDNYRNENDDEQVPSDKDKEDDSEQDAPQIATPTVIRDFPSIEQLSAPEDAMYLPDIYDKVSPSVVGVSCSVRGATQTGTGFVISEDGYIVTNAHVIENYISVMIVDGSLNEFKAEVIGYDTMTDIAVLKIDPKDIELVPVEFGKSSELRIGELAIAIGNPLGFDLYGTLTTGVISGLNRTVTIEDNTMNLIQTSATINHGNSGGPLIDAYGRVIGITSAKVDTTYGENLGFAIPIDEAIPIVENLIKYGYIPGRPSLGITAQNINELMSFYYNIPKGVYVFAVAEGSGADKAGIVAGDMIIAIEGESITTSEELNEVKNRYKVGDTVTLTVYRGNSNFDVDVVLGETTPNIQDRSDIN